VFYAKHYYAYFYLSVYHIPMNELIIGCLQSGRLLAAKANNT